MAEEANKPNVLLIPCLWRATTVRHGLYVHKGIGVGLGCVAYTLEQKSECSHLEQADVRT